MEGNDRSVLEMSEHLKSLVQRFDSEDMGDLLEQAPEAQFEIDLQPRKGYFRLEQSLASMLIRLARQRGISAETLLNLWVQEKLFTEPSSSQEKYPLMTNIMAVKEPPIEQLQMALA